jgi:hypothetical protein
MFTLMACHETETGDPGDGEPNGLANGTTPAEQLPEHPETFRIALSGGPCYGSCPTYSASLDQDGNVSFVGETCAARPGVFAHKVSREDAHAVYDALRATAYASLGDRYTTEEDGCDLWTDSPTYRWEVSADAETKPLERYAGCEGVAGLSEIDAVMQVFHERADILRFLEPPPFECDYGAASVVAASVRLSQAGVARALLKISNKNNRSGSFVLEDCSGVERARGDLQIESRRWVLLDESRNAISLPDALGEVGSLVVDLAPAATFNGPVSIAGVRGLRADDDLSFDFAPATDCTP